MFDIGFQELTIIGIVALLVVGPERLPGLARNVGLWVGRIRRYVAHVKDDIDREIRAQELRELIDKPKQELNELRSVVDETKGAVNSASTELEASREAFSESQADTLTPTPSDSQPSDAAPPLASNPTATDKPQTGDTGPKAPVTQPAVTDGEPSTRP